MKKILTGLLVIFSFYSHLALATDYIGDSFGDSLANQIWTPYGTICGKDSYINESSNLYINYGSTIGGCDGYWRISNVHDDPTSSAYYYKTPGADPTGTYTDNAHSAPGGNITEYIPEGGGATTTMATSSAMTYEENLLFNSIIVFFISLFGWGFIFSPLREIT
jgi:hypothetical protein